MKHRHGHVPVPAALPSCTSPLAFTTFAFCSETCRGSLQGGCESINNQGSSKSMSFWSKIFGGSSSEIFAAIKEGNLEKVKSLLKYNPDLVFKTDAAGWTPLHYAAHWNCRDIAELLLANR